MDLDEFDNDLDNCDLYIEDLKSEDPNVKVHAVSKLYSIAQIIGKERIENDLLPQILEIAQVKENEDEFVLQLTEQLGELRNTLEKEDMYILIPVLKVLACIDEPGIRDRAITKLKLIAEDQNEAFFNEYFLPLVKELGASENYTGRITAASLFAVCYKNITKNKKAEIRHLFTQLSSDSVAMVRRAIAANLKSLIEAFDKEYIKSNIIPLFTQLIKDDSDSVKINAIENSIHLIPYYLPEEIPVNLISLLKNTDPELRSWRVRYALPEALVGFSSEIDIEIVRSEILPLFENLLNDTEPEVRSRALNKLPEIFEKLTKYQLENDVINRLKALVTDTSLHVRLASASVLAKLCLILERSPLLSRLLPLVQILLRDEIIDVKIAAIKVLKSFNEKIGTHDVETDILPLMQAITNEKQWRCRLSLTEAFPEICKGMKYENFRTNFADFMFGFVTDHYCAVREQTIGNIDQFIQIYGFAQLSEKITSTLQELIVNQNYLFRIAALKMLGKLSYSFDITTFEDTLEIIVESLYKDRVPNVRLNLVQTLEELSQKISKQFANSYIIPTLEKLSSDKDSDVSYFANKALSKCKNI